MKGRRLTRTDRPPIGIDRVGTQPVRAVVEATSRLHLTATHTVIHNPVDFSTARGGFSTVCGGESVHRGPMVTLRGDRPVAFPGAGDRPLPLQIPGKEFRERVREGGANPSGREHRRPASSDTHTYQETRRW